MDFIKPSVLITKWINKIKLHWKHFRKIFIYVNAVSFLQLYMINIRNQTNNRYELINVNVNAAKDLVLKHLFSMKK